MREGEDNFATKPQNPLFIFIDHYVVTLTQIKRCLDQWEGEGGYKVNGKIVTDLPQNFA